MMFDRTRAVQIFVQHHSAPGFEIIVPSLSLLTLVEHLKEQDALHGLEQTLALRIRLWVYHLKIKATINISDTGPIK